MKKQLGVQCILGLTATANQSTVHHISELLDIKPEHVILGSSIPDNISITVSCETNRLQVSFIIINKGSARSFGLRLSASDYFRAAVVFL